MTARGSTSQKSEILSRMSAETGRSLRQMMTSGWMPIERSSRTECCVGFVFSSPVVEMWGRSVTWIVQRVVAALFVAHLADRLEERLAFDVADGAADLDDHDLRAGVAADGADAVLDLVGDVGDGLDGAAEVVAAALAGDDGLVDLAGRDGGGAGQVLVEEALVVAEVEVGLGAVGGDEDLAVLVRRHGAGVDVEVGVELLDDDGDVAGLEEPADGGGGDALANRANHAAGDEDVFGCHVPPSWLFNTISGGLLAHQ